MGGKKREGLEVPKKSRDGLWILPLEWLEAAAGKTLKRVEEEAPAAELAMKRRGRWVSVLCFSYSYIFFFLLILFFESV